MMTAEQFEAAWRRGRRRFDDVARVEVSHEFVAGWERRTRACRHECAAWLELAATSRPGNALRLTRIDELQAELWQLMLIRDRVQAINARLLPAPSQPVPQLGAI
jgi:hypothetical protein